MLGGVHNGPAFFVSPQISQQTSSTDKVIFSTRLKSLELATIVMPDESACGGRDPVSSNVLFFLDSG